MKKDFMVLASGVDTLHVSYEISWENEDLFLYLDDLKRAAKDSEKEEFGALLYDEGEYKFQIKPHGTNGYAFLLLGRDMDMKILDRMTPTTRPSLFVEFSSEALWQHGYEKLFGVVQSIINHAGGTIKTVKPSRFDLCSDILVPDDFWKAGLFDFLVTRARDVGCYHSFRRFSGMSIGKGAVVGRCYDKPLEIQQKSKKFWMYDIWGLTEVPEGYKIVRVEFQLRREAIKELGCNTMDDFREKLSDVWGYCTRQWLKLQDNPEKHHTQRKNLPFWDVVQEGFKVEKTLVRISSFKKDKDKLFSQLIGFSSSLAACLHGENYGVLSIAFQNQSERISPEVALTEVIKRIKEKEESEEFNFLDDVRRKLPKYSTVQIS